MSSAVTTHHAEPVRTVLVPRTFDQLVRFAEMAAQSELMPKDYKGKPGSIMIAVQMGSELGLAPMQALNSIAVINGRPGVWGDGLIGICRQSPLCEDIQESIEGEGETLEAVCVAKRRGASPVIGRFSVADARKAGLWQTEARVRRRSRDGGTYEAENDSPWFRYPKRMLQNRARGFALRDAFPDLLRGLKTVEELRDTPADDFRGSTLDAAAEPAQASLPTPGDKLDALEQALGVEALPEPAERAERAEVSQGPPPAQAHQAPPETAPSPTMDAVSELRTGKPATAKEPPEADVRWTDKTCLFLRTATNSEFQEWINNPSYVADRADLRENWPALSDQLEAGVEIARKRLHADADELETGVFGGPVT